MKSRKLCHKCKRTIEGDRPKWAKYCKECGRHRSRDWKREHPERTKLHGSDEANREWRERNDWNDYIRTWREEHPAEYRAQNRRHLREHRANKRARAAVLSAHSVLILACFLVLVLATQGCDSLPQLKISEQTLDHFDSVLLRLTATFALGAACLRLILHDLVRLISEFRRRKIESDLDVPAPRSETTSWSCMKVLGENFDASAIGRNLSHKSSKVGSLRRLP